MIPRGMLKIFSRSREEEARPCWGINPRCWEKDTLALPQCNKVSLDRCRLFRKEAVCKKAASQPIRQAPLGS